MCGCWQRRRDNLVYRRRRRPVHLSVPGREAGDYAAFRGGLSDGRAGASGYQLSLQSADRGGSLQVIENNKQRFAKKIQAKNQEGPPILHHQFRDQDEEYECVIDKIKTYREKGGSYRDIAILFRTNTQPRKLVEELISEGIPFRMRDALPNIYDHWIVKDIFSYLRMARDMKKGLVKRGRFSAGDEPAQAISGAGMSGQTSVISWEALLTWYDDRPWVCERIEKLEKDLKMCGYLSPSGALHYIRNIIGYEEYLKEYADYKGRKPEELLGILDELKELAAGFKSLEEWESHIAAIRVELAKQAKEREQNVDGVVLSTMHSSKGLEYRIVFIIDANEGITPHKRVIFEEDMEEERRLFYVAMTRAKELLYIFSVRKLYGKKAEQSRFVEELLDE